MQSKKEKKRKDKDVSKKKEICPKQFACMITPTVAPPWQFVIVAACYCNVSAACYCNFSSVSRATFLILWRNPGLPNPFFDALFYPFKFYQSFFASDFPCPRFFNPPAPSPVWATQTSLFQSRAYDHTPFYVKLLQLTHTHPHLVLLFPLPKKFYPHPLLLLGL